jgi:Protein of unknown function (DUF3592)
MSSAWIGGVVGWCAVTVFMLVAAWWLRSNDAAFKAKATRAIATVVENGRTEYRDEKRRKTVDTYDVYEFTAANGQRVRFNSPNTALHPPAAVGAQAEIIYDPNDAKGARLADDSLTRTATLLVWLSPIGLVIAGVIYLLWMRTRS